MQGYISDSGFTNDEILSYDKKYFDVYLSNSNKATFNNRILGDATGELGPFYAINTSYFNNWWKDASEFLYPSRSWFFRGGAYSHGRTAGLYFYGTNGQTYGDIGFKLVLLN
jgi:hypothetical protein